MPKGIYIHKSLGGTQKLKIGIKVSALWQERRKGKTYEEIFGTEKADAMKVKMRLAKLGKSFKWSKPHPKGEAHPRWLKDRTQVKNRRKNSLDEPRYKQWRGAVFLRDGYKCRIGDNTCSNYLEAHHILPWRSYPELRFNVNNGIALCRAHHPRRRAEEKRLAPIFKKLVLTTVSN